MGGGASTLDTKNVVEEVNDNPTPFIDTDISAQIARRASFLGGFTPEVRVTTIERIPSESYVSPSAKIFDEIDLVTGLKIDQNIKVLNHRPIDDESALVSCDFLYSLANKGHDVNVALGNANACDTLLKLIQDFPDNVILMKRVLELFIMLVMGCEPNREKCGGLSLFEPLITMLSAHTSNTDISTIGCDFIFHLSDGDKVTSEKLGQSGACQVIMEMLEKCSTHTATVGACLSAIRKLTVSSQTNRVVVGNFADRLDQRIIIVESALANISDAYVAEQFTRSLTNLGAEGGVKTKLGVKACVAIIQAMRVHSMDPVVVEHGLRAMINISAHSVINKKSLGEAGACAIVIDVLKNHSTYPAVIEQGFYAAYNLSFDQNNKETLLSLGFEAVALSLSENIELPEGVRTFAGKALVQIRG